jgi:hypothetical protein
MTRDELKSILMEEIGNIAPDVDPAAVREDVELQEVLDLPKPAVGLPEQTLLALGHQARCRKCR